MADKNDELKTTLSELLESLGVTDDWTVENIKETAMNRNSLKKGKRKYVKKILDDAFELLRNEGRLKNG